MVLQLPSSPATMDEQPAPNAMGDEAWCEREAAAVGKENGPS